MANIISLKEGRDSYQNYLTRDPNPIKIGETVFRSYTVDKDQLTAMANLLKDFPNLAGFRIYVGLNAGSQRVGIVVGVNADGTETTNQELFSTGWGIGGPCPPICDKGSQMI